MFLDEYRSREYQDAGYLRSSVKAPVYMQQSIYTVFFPYWIPEEPERIRKWNWRSQIGVIPKPVLLHPVRSRDIGDSGDPAVELMLC
jgi:hypothetical protein